MGSGESRFAQLLAEGNEDEALILWKDNFDLQVNFQPDVQIKASPHRDTPLHCAVRHEMRELTVEFLSVGANPFVMNGKGETPLHLVCRSSRHSSRTSKKRADFLKLLLDRVPMKEPIAATQDFEAKEKSVGMPAKRGFLSSFMKEKDEGTSNGLAHMFDSFFASPDHGAHHLGVKDGSRNTPLHLAAASGLLECVELLVAHYAPLFAHNVAGQTPCDVAWEAKQIIIAKQLEARMVFDSLQDTGEASKEEQASRRMNKSFHNSKALKSLRQDIIAGMATKLEISEFSAQALLMAYGWSEELLKEAWQADRAAACEKAGISLETIQQDRGGGELDLSPASLTVYSCEICYEDVLSRDRVKVPCNHTFCNNCWRTYLDDQINEGGGKEIRCPAYQCFKLVPDRVIGRLISNHQMERYSELAVQNFVDSSAEIRWCPFPDCGYAICMRKDKNSQDPEDDEVRSKENTSSRGGSEGASNTRSKGASNTGSEEANSSGGEGSSSSGTEESSSSEGAAEGATALSTISNMTPGVNVECGQGHGFCWECLKEPHEPCCCELWERWQSVTISCDNVGVDMGRLTAEAKDNAVWIAQNTKPCPNCKSPIQKSEGCNHMNCKKCRHEFCWVCLDPWRVHSHRTGGYFICNRYSAQQKAKKEVDKARNDMEKHYMEKAVQDLAEHQRKLDHYHSRYSNHLRSIKIEVELLQRSQAKLREMEKLGQVLDKKVAVVRAAALMDSEEEHAEEVWRSFPNLKGNFLDEIFRALLHSRRILASSYCLGYFLPEDRKESVQAHESLQGKLEEAVELLSQIVNREYLLIPKHKINEAARNVECLCEEYLSEMKSIAIMVARVVLGIEDEERRIQKEEQRRREEEERANRPPSPQTIAELRELFFIEHLIRLMDGEGRLHIFIPQGQPQEEQGEGAEQVPENLQPPPQPQARQRHTPHPGLQRRPPPRPQGGATAATGAGEARSQRTPAATGPPRRQFPSPPSQS